jgi:prevent-host-death family protein
MNSVNIAEAGTRLSELVDLAEAGEVINITRDGKPVARITPVAKQISSAGKKKLEPLDLELMRRVRASLPFDDEPAGEFVRRMRDEDRY